MVLHIQLILKDMFILQLQILIHHRKGSQVHHTVCTVSTILFYSYVTMEEVCSAFFQSFEK